MTVQDVAFLSPAPFQVEPFQLIAAGEESAHQRAEAWAGLSALWLLAVSPSVRFLVSLSLSLLSWKNGDTETPSEGRWAD